MDSTHGQNQVNESSGKTTNVSNTLKWSTAAISERRMHISSKILRIGLFSLTIGIILTSNNYGTRHVNWPRCLFHSFSCTTHVYLSPCVYMSLAVIWLNVVTWFPTSGFKLAVSSRNGLRTVMYKLA